VTSIEGRGGALPLRIQLHQDPPHASDEVRNGRWRDGSLVGSIQPRSSPRSRGAGS